LCKGRETFYDGIRTGLWSKGGGQKKECGENDQGEGPAYQKSRPGPRGKKKFAEVGKAVTDEFLG